MLTDRQVQQIRSVMASTRQDGLRVAFHVYNTLADVEVEAVVDVLKADVDLLSLAPASVGSHD